MSRSTEKKWPSRKNLKPCMSPSLPRESHSGNPKLTLGHRLCASFSSLAFFVIAPKIFEIQEQDQGCDQGRRGSL